MSQFDWATLLPTETSGTQLADKLNQYKGAANSNHSGATRPAYVVAGMIWLDTSSEPWRLKLFDGADDIVVMQFDPVGNTPIIGLGAEVEVESAATVNLAQQKSNLVRITGTTAITSFGNAGAGILRFLQFTGALTLTHGANLDLPGGADIATAVGDRAIMLSVGANAWRCVSYTRANGSTPANRDASVAQYRAKAAKLVTAETAFAAAALVSLTDAATIAVDLSLGFNFKVTLSASRTLGYPSNRVPGQTGRIKVVTNGYGLSYAAGYVFTNGIAPALGAKAYLDYFVDEDAVHLMGARLA